MDKCEVPIIEDENGVIREGQDFTEELNTLVGSLSEVLKKIELNQSFNRYFDA